MSCKFRDAATLLTISYPIKVQQINTRPNNIKHLLTALENSFAYNILPTQIYPYMNLL